MSGIGNGAGQTSQGPSTVAMGGGAGASTQGEGAVAIGCIKRKILIR